MVKIEFPVAAQKISLNYPFLLSPTTHLQYMQIHTMPLYTQFQID